LSPKQAIALQTRLASQVSRVASPTAYRWIAGLDAAFTPDGRSCIAAVVLWDLRERKVAEQYTARRRLTFPYVPGLLSFRETPALLLALRKLKRPPDVLMCDGQGYAHPRRFGLACHIGVLTHLPSIGCAKTRLIGSHEEVPNARGLSVPLWEGEEQVGSVLRTQNGVRPLYLSIGHRMDLSTACRIVLDCAGRYRLPEPTRLADQWVSRARKQPAVSVASDPSTDRQRSAPKG
jgi:deoxyribonuclease V